MRPTRARLDALEAAGHPVLRLTHAHRRARRRVLPLGIRHRRRRGGARHQPVRRAERVGSRRTRPRRSSTTYAAAGRLPEPPPSAGGDPRVFSGTLHRRPPPGGRSRSDRLDCGRGDYVAFLSYLPGGRDIETAIAERPRRRSAPRTARRDHVRRRAALPALDRAVPQGRAEHARRLRDHRRRRDQHGDSGSGLYVRGAEAGAGARRRRRRSKRTSAGLCGSTSMR